MFHPEHYEPIQFLEFDAGGHATHSAEDCQAKVRQIRHFIQHIYSSLYNIRIDVEGMSGLDNTTVMYTEEARNQSITSAGQLVYRELQDLPSAALFVQDILKMQLPGYFTYAELGRMASSETHSRLLRKKTMAAVEAVAVHHHVDIVVALVESKNVPLYTRWLGAVLVHKDIDENWGSDKRFSSMVWPVSDQARGYFGTGAQVSLLM